MNKLDIRYLIETLEAAERDISPDGAEYTARDIEAGRERISYALRCLRGLRADAPKAAPVGSKQDSKVTHSDGVPQQPRYVIGTDTPPRSPHTPAQLYRNGSSAGEYVLAASGSIEQMRALADELNGGRS